ncbi:MAG: hypothetical protein JWN89_775 [Parcubacteria group bacterium]|nr:hypothetical protein [Parcubacteria group bacterium]
MVKFTEMAKFMDDEVVGEVGREKNDSIVKVQIPLRRTASPSPFVVLDGHAVVFKFIESIKMLEPLFHQTPCFFFVPQVLRRGFPNLLSTQSKSRIFEVFKGHRSSIP